MLWVKSLHIIFVITWMAAIFYLPRLFVYHVQALNEGDTRGSERFKIMERKLFNGIMTPGAVLSIVFGLWLWLGYGISGGWLHAKLTLVLLLIVFHGLCWSHLRAFRDDRNTRSERYFRIINELPVFLLFGIVIFVVVKPF
ncbi:MAG TPA: protoporphyrinogen oxidase HemJ [Casimicrobium huifangae]|jgi:putative membrane protein|uniref:protoporphyrinogen oxidase HemJ n=1 Tax=Casimicrobium huifangae TaxID=2591109 RepID=UPI002BE08A5D|nr:protoporphyrinogen oxidase HemJ [Casimicrobium huifangae]HQA34106.1 protoporphyrinogen oxidase HemJ [Casimicrobium huifangae]HQD64882.1 protoporphyrinogen oxidase HemJ [Casimicrobium huifangae]